MHEMHFVRIGIAEMKRHRVAASRDVQCHILVVQQASARSVPVRGISGKHRIEIEGVRPQRPFEMRPVRRRMCPVQMRDRTEKSLASELFLEGAFGNRNVRLSGMLALVIEEHGRAFCVENGKRQM